MADYRQISRALAHIDAHLSEPLTISELAETAYFSPYYFHRLFTAVAGMPLNAYIRQRRLAAAGVRLCATRDLILDIALDCGFNSAQAFSRAFARAYGVSPREFRRAGRAPDSESVDEIIKRFTNRLRGGIDMNPRIIKSEKLRVAGVSGDGSKTGEVWQKYIELDAKSPAPNKASDDGYEIRTYDGENCVVHVGCRVKDDNCSAPYEIIAIPASYYAAFDVYVSEGYDSENAAMSEWLASNEHGWRERLIDGKHICVEYYDERFNGDEAGSIVEIRIPIEK